MESYHIFNARIVNESRIFEGEVFISGGLIKKINEGKNSKTPAGYTAIDAKGQYLLPGVIDDQVHFRQPGMEEKATIYSESRAAVAGGVTSYMEMPNTKPPTLTQDLLEAKYKIASKDSLANYSFYMGVSNDNIEEVLKTPLDTVCGIKIFLGSSTGNLLVDNTKTIEKLFAETPHIIAAHCEDEETIQRNTESFKDFFGDEISASVHPAIRSVEACFKSSSYAVALARKKKTRLHVFHVSTAKELELFDAGMPLEKKRITAEVCVHHLWFTNDYYRTHDNLVKWNPAIKTAEDRKGLRDGLKAGLLDVVATDHAPHLLAEKMKPYFEAPSGGPMVQHSLQAMIAMSESGLWSLADVVNYMCHKPAILFNVAKRGFIREGYYADLVLVDTSKKYKITRSNILYKCGWSPLEGETLPATIAKTFVNGHLVWDNGKVVGTKVGKRLGFERG